MYAKPMKDKPVNCKSCNYYYQSYSDVLICGAINAEIGDIHEVDSRCPLVDVELKSEVDSCISEISLLKSVLSHVRQSVDDLQLILMSDTHPRTKAGE